MVEPRLGDEALANVVQRELLARAVLVLKSANERAFKEAAGEERRRQEARLARQMSEVDHADGVDVLEAGWTVVVVAAPGLEVVSVVLEEHGHLVLVSKSDRCGNRME